MTVKLTEQEKNTIVSVFNMTEARARKFYKAYEQAEDDIQAEYNLELYKKNTCELWGMQNLLRALGVVICYDWPGHRGEWFFPTAEEIDYQLDYEDDLRRDG